MRALILRKQAYGESDLIVQFFLETNQVVSGFAPGARKSRRRFSHQFHPAGIYQLEAPRHFEPGVLIRIQRCDLEFVYSKLTENIDRWTRWAMVLEWILADEGQGFEFEVVLKLMHDMAETESSWSFYRFFVLQMQSHGLLPRLDQCVSCGQPVKSRAIFSVAEGGVGHPECVHGLALSEGTLDAIFQMLDPLKSTELLERHHLELDQIMVPFLSYHLGRSMKSQRLLNEIRTQPEATL